MAYNNNEVRFSHNGKPFSFQNLVYLIEQTSTKERKQDTEQGKEIKTTGKYGTGFMTTNLLSKMVLIEGVVYDDIKMLFVKFKLSMNRNAKTPEEMIDNIEKSINQLTDQLNKGGQNPLKFYVVGNDLDTTFTYKLENEESRQTARIGIEDLKKNITTTLSFLD